jgi:hypothetical protein
VQIIVVVVVEVVVVVVVVDAWQQTSPGSIVSHTVFVIGVLPQLSGTKHKCGHGAGAVVVVVDVAVVVVVGG